MNTSAFGQRVRQLRQQQGLRQEDLGKLVGCGITHISNIELGKNTPGADMVHRLDEALGANGELVSRLRHAKVPDRPSTAETSVTAHLFFPAVLSLAGTGPSANEPFQPIAYQDATAPTYALYLYPFQVAVAHETHQLTVTSLSELADWRDQQLNRRSAVVKEHLQRHAIDAEVTTSDPYGLACFCATQLQWTDEVRINRAIQLMSSLSLLRDGASDPDREHRMLSTQADLPSSKTFGLPNSHIGWAAWAGVAMYVHPHGALAEAASSELEQTLIRGEIELQAVWCYASYVAETGTAIAPPFGNAFLRAARRRLISPAGSEHTSRRHMREAVVETSRVNHILEAAIDALA